MLAAQDIAIERLRIKAEPHAAQQIARELANATWPLTLPSNMRDAWVFVRELHVQSQARTLRQQSALALENILVRAVDGRLAAAEHAQAVRFESLPELLAFLLSDLAQGNAFRRWYWARWSYVLRQPRDQAIAQLLVENHEHIAAIAVQLNAIGELTRVWNCLTSASAAQIIRQLQRFFRINFSTSLGSVSTQINASINHQAKRQLRQREQQSVMWSSALRGLSVDDQRVRLAAIVSGLEYCPLLLMRDTAAVVNAFSEVVFELAEVPLSVSSSVTEVTASLVAHDEAAALRPDMTDDNSVARKAAVTSERSESQRVAPLDKKVAVAKNAKTTPSIEHVNTTSFYKDDSENERSSTSHQFASKINSSAQADTIHNESSAELLETVNTGHQPFVVGDHFYTNAGGIFYFINPISWFLAKEHNRENIIADVANGWLWLHDLAHLFEQNIGLCDESVIDITVSRFIAHSAGVDVGELNANAITSWIQTLFESMSQRYSKKSFWTLEQNSLLRVPAQVVANASHIDVYFPLSRVNLDVRIAALDVNPGWVPWLGRVVNFHYTESSVDVHDQNNRE